MNRIKIAVTGCNGQVGKSLDALKDEFPQFSFTFLDRNSLDISDPVHVSEVISELSPDYCINTAAYTAVDKAESEEELAYKINKDAVQFLCDALVKVGGKLIHYSTDYVYGGMATSPITESNATQTDGVYAASKLAGDEVALQHAVPSLILRTSWVYSPFGHNFVKTMLRLSESIDELGIVDDQIGGPTYALDLARITLQVISLIEDRIVDIDFFNDVYHCSNEGAISWADFAVEIFKQSGKVIKVNRISTKDYPSPASRPAYSVLDKSKLKARFALTMPNWDDSLLKCLKELNK